MPEDLSEPYLNCHFQVEVVREDGHLAELGPSQVSSLKARRYRRPLLFGIVFVRPQDHARIKIRRGITSDKYLFNWYQLRLTGKPAKREVRVFQYGRDYDQPVNTWIFEECYPVSWQGPAFHALRSGVAFEEIQLAYPTIKWAEP